MRKKDITTSIKIYQSIEELPAETQELIEIAKEASEKAWSPYSLFNVGAALKLDNGEIITGNNQENVAFPSGLCAERTALFYAASQYPGMAVKIIALAAYSKGKFIEMPISPCGACRQVMLEYENRSQAPMEIVMYGTKEIVSINSAEGLLPLPFDYNLAL